MPSRDAPGGLRLGARGVLAAMAMTGIRQVTTGLGLVKQTPPDAIAHQEAWELLARLPEPRRRAVIEAAHWGYGGVAGLAFGVVVPVALRRSRLAGAAYGLAMWAVFQAGIARVLDLPHQERDSIHERLALAADHLFYGALIAGPQ